VTTIHRISTGLALMLALAVIAAPASARPFDLNANGSYVPATTTTNSGARSDVSSTNGYDFARVPSSVVRIVSGDTGFDWGDAGIGAAGGLALAMVGLGGAVVVSQSRARRTHRTKTLPS
jgi:hypothetical protein